MGSSAAGFIDNIWRVSACSWNSCQVKQRSDCDFVVKNFEIRQTARDEEVEALRQAKAILSGAKFEAFLQGA